MKPQAIVAEGLGTLLLLATVVGSGIMAERLAGGNQAIALLGNTIPTGAMLVVLILIFGPISGAHFNPLVTLTFLWRGEARRGEAMAYIPAQIIGAVLGVWLAHLMFDEPVLQVSLKARAGFGQLASEFVATFGLIATILGVARHRADTVPWAVGLYITAAYWFTASTSFANPAVTIARALTNSFSGIAPVHVLPFIAAQALGAAAAAGLFAWLHQPANRSSGLITTPWFGYRLIPRRRVGSCVGESGKEVAQRALAQFGQRGGGLDFAFESIERGEEHPPASGIHGRGRRRRFLARLVPGGRRWKAPRPHTPGGDSRARSPYRCEPGWPAGGPAGGRGERRARQALRQAHPGDRGSLLHVTRGTARNV